MLCQFRQRMALHLFVNTCCTVVISVSLFHCCASISAASGLCRPGEPASSRGASHLTIYQSSSASSVPSRTLRPAWPSGILHPQAFRLFCRKAVQGKPPPRQCTLPPLPRTSGPPPARAVCRKGKAVFHYSQRRSSLCRWRAPSQGAARPADTHGACSMISHVVCVTRPPAMVPTSPADNTERPSPSQKLSAVFASSFSASVLHLCQRAGAQVCPDDLRVFPDRQHRCQLAVSRSRCPPPGCPARTSWAAAVRRASSVGSTQAFLAARWVFSFSSSSSQFTPWTSEASAMVSPREAGSPGSASRSP